MTLSSFNIFVLIVSLTFLLAQVFVRKKHTSHILFAIFCGSIAMTLAKDISDEYIGAYQYLIGLGTVATCNCYWLLSRSLFRRKDAIGSHHLVLALAISLLIFIKQGYLFASSASIIVNNDDSLTPHILSELTVLLSSCMLVLPFWEGCRGYKSASKQDKAQRIFFLISFSSAVMISKMSLAITAIEPGATEWVISSLILFVLINTQVLMVWRYRKPQEGAVTNQTETTKVLYPLSEPQDNAAFCVERQTAEAVKSLLIEQKLFLRANLKVGDIAKALNLPEYRVSKVFRSYFNAKNFNQYINELRIEYAREILMEPSKKQWPVLVVGLESGFASVGPFTRAFKTQTGLTPNQYRQNHLESLSIKAAG